MRFGRAESKWKEEYMETDVLEIYRVIDRMVRTRLGLVGRLLGL